MSIILGSTTIDAASYGGTTLDKVVMSDGTVIFENKVPITFVEGSSSTTVEYKKGSTVSRSSSAPSGYSFAGWSLDGSSSSRVSSFTADTARTVYRVCSKSESSTTDRSRHNLSVDSTSHSLTTNDNYQGYYITPLLSFPTATNASSVDFYTKFSCTFNYRIAYAYTKLWFYNSSGSHIVSTDSLLSVDNYFTFSNDFYMHYGIGGTEYGSKLSGISGRISLIFYREGDPTTVTFSASSITMTVKDIVYSTSYAVC